MLHSFSNNFFKIEARVVILRYLLQSMLPFSLALTRMRQQDFQKLERLLAVFLWGSAEDGRAKVAQAAWRRVALPLDLGGAGVWSLHLFQKALMAKLVLNSIDVPSSLWSSILWGIHVIFQEMEVKPLFLQLSLRWLVDFEPSHWVLWCRKRWTAGTHRRDSFFLWRLLNKAFFTGSRAALIQVVDGVCSCCGRFLEDLSHLFFLCPNRRGFWESFSTLFPPLVGFVRAVSDGEPFLLALNTVLMMRKGARVFYLLVISRALRFIWRVQCAQVFRGVTPVLSCNQPLLEAAEVMLAQFSRSGEARRRVLKKALGFFLGVGSLIPYEYVLQITGLV
ncbi:hypothetical protein R1sor_007188 [Riccia sorocarpa]|uniref:Reverse transcriptase zinc-binding domain-containing protein n=1 Tax=Riccia sorocarpa TaxID=122646 RepID=A0ABD3HT83_9MARC